MLSKRVRDWAVRFGVTAVSVCFLAAAQYLMMPQIVARVEGLHLLEQDWAIAALRSDWLIFHVCVIAMIAIYWLLAALFASDQYLHIKAANVVLALSITVYAFITLYGSFVPDYAALEVVCPILGVSETDSPFGFDAQSSCQIFSYNAHLIIVFSLVGLALLSFLASIIQRIMLSRRSAKI